MSRARPVVTLLAWCGVSLSAVAAAPSAPAVFVESVQQGSPADEAGLKAGDALDAVEVPSGSTAPAKSVWDALRIQAEREALSAVKLRVRRGNERLTVAIEPVRWAVEFRPALEGQDLESLGARRFETIASAAEKRRDAASAAWAWMRDAEAAYTKRDAARTEQSTRAAIDALHRAKLAELEPLLWRRRLRLAWARWDAATARDAGARAHALLTGAYPNTRLLPSVQAGEGDAFLQMRDVDSARKAYEAALAILSDADPQSQLRAEVRLGLGAAAIERRELPAVIENANAALTICTSACRHTSFYAELLRLDGAVKSLSGKDEEARARWAQGLEVAQHLAPDTLVEARLLSSVGVGEWRSGRLSVAEDYFRHALAIAQRDAPGTIMEAGLLNNLGIVHHLRFDYEAARLAYERAAEIFASVSPHSAETARALTNVALVAGLAGDNEGALKALDKVLGIQLETKVGGADVAYTYHAMALSYERLERWPEAEANFRRAIELRKGLNIGGQALNVSVQSLADVLRQDPKRLDEAATLFRQALKLEDRLFPESQARAEALYGLGMIARQQKKLEEAADLLGRAVEVIEAQEQLIGGAQEVRSSYAARYAHFYKDYMEVLLELGRTRGAFENLERYRARVFRAMLAERGAFLDSALPPALRAERDRLGKEFEATTSALQRISDPEGESAKVDELLTRLATIRDQRKTLFAGIREAAPGLAAARYPRAYEYDDRRRLLYEDTALLSFAVSPSAVHVFILEPVTGRGGGAHTKLSTIKLPLTAEQLRRDIEAWQLLMKASVDVTESRRALMERSNALYTALIEPMRKQLAHYHHWLIVPDGPLHFLPFAALVTHTDAAAKPRYLVQDVAVSQVLAVSLLEAARAQPAPRKSDLEIVAFADPLAAATQTARASSVASTAVPRDDELGPLPWSREEASAVSGLFGSKARLHMGNDVTEQAILDEAPRARRIHFATHAVLDSRSPLDSYLVLARAPGASDPGMRSGEASEGYGRLRAAEIFERLDLHADLVALSACATAGGNESAGEGLMGLTRAFHFAGASHVLSSLWPVSDRSTSRLMVAFYRRLRSGESAPDALRAAQIQMLSSAGSHPFHWAAFQLSSTRE